MRFLRIILLSFIFLSPSLLLAKEAKPLSVKEKKKRFFSILLPYVDSVYNELNAQYKDIKANLKNIKYKKKIENLKNIYNITTDKELLMALKPHPKSITLAQAAMESAWGTSRFYKQANNIFGVWSFNEQEPRMAASQKRGEKTIWLKEYPSIRESIRDYYINVSRSHAFDKFRELNMKTSNPYKLVKKLTLYSEMREKYTKELAMVIRYNKLEKYDKP